MEREREREEEEEEEEEEEWCGKVKEGTNLVIDHKKRP